MLKIAAAVFLIITLVVTISMCQKNGNETADEDVIGVWVSYGDFKVLGLYNQDENGFRRNAEMFLDDAEDYGINTIYFHVRAFRDAVYDSEYFPTASYFWDREDEPDYDPLEIMVELAHENGMKIHAWMNPYRNTSFEEDILDPASEETTDEILQSVEEVLTGYEVDGIHFDDYFYEEGNTLPEDEKMKNVNSMVRAVYEKVHEYDRLFGISPAGNTSYCKSIGADIETWLSEEGYIDYIVPQIYWTDEHTAPWRDDMFSDTLDEWCGLNENGSALYVGLALYKTGLEEVEDPGWQNRDNNIAEQVQQIKEKGCGGYVFFTAGDLYRDTAAAELANYRALVF